MKVRCTNERCHFGRGKGQMVSVDDRKDCRFAEDCAAWRAARGLDEPPPQLPYWHQPTVIAGGVAAVAVGCGLLLHRMSGDDEKTPPPVPPQVPPIAVESPSLLRSRAEGTVSELHAAAYRILRTHRAILVAEDTMFANDDGIASTEPIDRTMEGVVERFKTAHEDSRLLSKVYLERREEIRSDNILYIDSLVRLSSYSVDVTDPMLENLSVRVSGVLDKQAALDLIRVHLDATRQASGKLDEERVFEDFKKSVPIKP